MADHPAPRGGTYLLCQRLRYTYDGPVHRLRHRLVVVPRAVHGHQVRLDHAISVSGSPALVSESTDAFGNHVIEVRAAEVAALIDFDVRALVQRDGPGGVTPLDAGAVGDRRLLAPTFLTQADAVLADAARGLAAGPGGLDLAERACSWAHGALAYEHDATGVRTTAAEALAGGRGVCQDYAHVMLALCRAAGLPARYVSGHLAGEGGSHAWVEVVVADGSRGATAVAFDPTHDRRAGYGYLTVAVGRDYADAAPTSGTFEGDGRGVLSTSKRLALVGTAADPSLAAASSV